MTSPPYHMRQSAHPHAWPPPAPPPTPHRPLTYIHTHTLLPRTGAVDAQNFTQEQAKKMAGTIIAGCKDLKSKTCQIYLKTAGTFCTNPKNVKFCSNILMVGGVGGCGCCLCVGRCPTSTQQAATRLARALQSVLFQRNGLTLNPSRQTRMHLLTHSARTHSYSPTQETCKVSKTECGRLKGPFCAQTGAQKANCEKMASNALKAMG